MLEKKKGAIVNIGSAAGTIPDPLYSVYSGSKAFVRALSTDCFKTISALPDAASCARHVCSGRLSISARRWQLSLVDVLASPVKTIYLSCEQCPEFVTLIPGSED